VSAGTLIEGALRRDRVLVVGCLLFAITLSWAYLLTGAGMMQEMGDMLMPMSSGPWTPGHALIVLLMWAVMMAAMMLPSAAPMILLHATLARRRRAVARLGRCDAVRRSLRRPFAGSSGETHSEVAAVDLHLRLAIHRRIQRNHHPDRRPGMRTDVRPIEFENEI
jgi:hypothetical protein